MLISKQKKAAIKVAKMKSQSVVKITPKHLSDFGAILLHSDQTRKCIQHSDFGASDRWQIN